MWVAVTAPSVTSLSVGTSAYFQPKKSESRPRSESLAGGFSFDVRFGRVISQSLLLGVGFLGSNPKFEILKSSISDGGLLSDFGIRPSDFVICTGCTTAFRLRACHSTAKPV